MPMSLLELVAHVMQTSVENVGEDGDFETVPAWDSAREVELALALEHHYGIALQEQEMERLHSMREIRDVLRSHGVDV